MALRAYTAPELALLRSKGQWVKTYLTVFKPATVYTARVNGVPSSNDKVAEIEYDGGTGTLGNVKNGMTIRFGSAAGLRDRGEERIRKTPDSNTFFFGETSSIDWTDNDFITVVDDFQLRAKHIRISGSSALIDYDVAYSDQHTAFDPVPVMGSHRVVWLTGATVAITIPQIANSWVIGSTISSRLTTCAGATVTNGTTSNPTITFNAPGRYVVYTTVTAANGKSFTGVRYVYVHSATDMPYSDFELTDFSGSYEDGGFSAHVRLFTDSADVSNFEEGTLVVLHVVDYYDNEPQTIEIETGTGNILFIGRISNEKITVNKEVAVVEFDIDGFQERGKKTDQQVNLSGVAVNEGGGGSALFSMAPGHVSRNYFPYGVQIATNTPDAWTSMPSLTVKRALFDLLHWYSTATAIMDVYIEDDSRLASELIASGETLWEKINELAFQTIFASPGVDPFGRLFIEIEPQLVPEASRTAVEIMEILPVDWTSSVEIARNPTERGSSEIIDRLLLSSQTQSNQLAGLYYGWKHNEFGKIQIELAQNNRGFTLFPRQVAYIEIAAADNSRGITLDTNLIPREVSYDYDPRTGTLLPTVAFEAETFEAISVNGDIPGSEDDDWSIPPPLPPLPPLPPFTPVFPGDPTAEENGPAVVVAVDSTKGILFTENFNDPVPTKVVWRLWNAGIAAADITLIVQNNPYAGVIMCPNGSVYVAVRRIDQDRWYNKIYYAPALGGMFQLIIDQTWINTNELSGGGIIGLGCNPNKAEEVAFIAGNIGGGSKHFWLGNAAGWTQKVLFTAATNFTGGLTFGGGKWVWDLNFAGNEHFLRFNEDGSVVENSEGGFGQGFTYWHTRAGTSPVVVKSKPLVTGVEGMLRSEDNTDNVTAITVAEEFGAYIAIAPDGLHMMANWDRGAGLRGKSSDGGFSWAGLPNLIFGGEYCFAYAGGSGVDSRWIAGRGTIKYSANFGDNWEDRTGNLQFLIPVNMNIVKIIIPGLANNGN